MGEAIKMNIQNNRLNAFLAISIVCIMVTVAVLPTTMAVNLEFVESFDNGPSYLPVTPIEKITFVNFDEETFVDDYAYLASIPTSVFRNNDRLNYLKAYSI